MRIVVAYPIEFLKKSNGMSNEILKTMSDMWYVLFKMLPFIIIVDFLTENLIMLLGSHTYSILTSKPVLLKTF